MDRELRAAERTLLAHVASDIKEHPDKYREAGKWLDRYYDDDELCWTRRQLELMREIKRIEDEDVNCTYDELMLPELKDSLAMKLPPPSWMRLSYALEDLWYNYRMGGILAEKDARAILIITWVATDVEANSADLGITKFADLTWEKGRMGLIHDLFLEREASTSKFSFFKYDDEDYLKLVYIAWHKLFGETVEGAIIIQEMRRALVSEERLLGLDGQKNVDSVLCGMTKIEAEKELQPQEPAGTEQEIKSVKKRATQNLINENFTPSLLLQGIEKFNKLISDRRQVIKELENNSTNNDVNKCLGALDTINKELAVGGVAIYEAAVLLNLHTKPEHVLHLATNLGEDEEDKYISKAEDELLRLIIEAKTMKTYNKKPAGAGQKNTPKDTKEQLWRDDTPDYMLLSEAIVKLADNKPKLPTLSKKITPNGPIRYMRRGQRCKVHIGDFRDFIKNRYPTLEFANEIADEVLADREAMKEKIDRQKKTGK